MSLEYRDVLNAAAQARRAIRLGDAAAAERWLKLLDRTADAAANLAQLARKRAALADLEKLRAEKR
jgi:hypothetical protein